MFSGFRDQVGRHLRCFGGLSFKQLVNAQLFWECGLRGIQCVQPSEPVFFMARKLKQGDPLIRADLPRRLQQGFLKSYLLARRH
jgi:hypothetical protein